MEEYKEDLRKLLAQNEEYKQFRWFAFDASGTQKKVNIWGYMKKPYVTCLGWLGENSYYQVIGKIDTPIVEWSDSLVSIDDLILKSE